jgi:hypothetical protein
MSTTEKKHIAWFFWPFHALWRLLTGILALTGRMLLVILGIVLVTVGIILSLTVVGALIGIPLAITGFLGIVRGLF